MAILIFSHDFPLKPDNRTIAGAFFSITQEGTKYITSVAL
jgi:hypothetical protein